MGMTLLLGFLVFTIVTTAFAIFNVYDENSYVLVSAVTELYALTMLNLNTYFSYFLAFVFSQSHQ